MNHPSDEHLLGYVLGALDAQEQRNLQEAIDANPQLDDRLLEIKSSLSPLDYLDTCGPRPGLARRTCELVANLDSHPIRRFNTTEFLTSPSLSAALAAITPSSVSPVDAKSLVSPIAEISQPAIAGFNANIPPVHVVSKTFSSDGDRRLWQPATWSLPDLAVAVALMAVVAGVLFPAVSYTRYNSRLMYCQDNLRQLGQAFYQFSETHGGRFVEIPRSGPLSVSGSFAPLLKDAGFVSDDGLFSCAGVTGNSSEEPPVRIPTLETIEQATGDQLIQLQRRMGGHYGYSMGYCTSDGLVPPQNLGRTNVVLLADMPSLNCSGRVSFNHGGRGQNCLFEDGHVRFVAGESIGEDAIFVNDYNLVAPGCRPEDNVIAPSHLSPAASPQR